MARRLGEVLIEKGDLNPRDLAEALRSQRIFGGSLGTHLLQLGFIEEEELIGALAKMHDVPLATRSMLLGANADARSLLSSDFCNKHMAVPFRMSGEDLCLALRNPADADVVREAAFLSGRNIIPHIALETVLREVVFGPEEQVPDARVQQPEESNSETETSKSDGPSGPRKVSTATLNTQDLEIPVDLINSLKAANDAASGLNSADLEAHGALDSAARMQAGPVDTDEIPAPEATAAAAAEPPRSLHSPPRSSALLDESDLREDGPRPNSPPCPRLAEIGRLLANARDRDAVLNVALAAVNALMPRAAIFAVRRNEAVLWKSDGFEVEGDLTVPLHKSSVLSAVHEGASFAFGPVTNTPANTRLFEQLGGGRPHVALVLPVVVRGRTVVALYGDSLNPDTPSPDFSRLGKLAGLITMALEAVILRGKILRESGASEASGPVPRPASAHTPEPASSASYPG